jgi:hypothetical protein
MLPRQVQKCLKTTPLESKADYATLRLSFVLSTIRFCKQFVCLYVHQILHIHSILFARS